MKKTIVILTLAIIGFSACKKKDNGTPATNYTKVDTLQNGQWKLVSITNPLIGDLTTSMKSCQKDNLYTFNADKTITVDEGGEKCNTADMQTRVDGNWNLTSDYKQISISSSVFATLGITTLTGDVVQINSTTMEVKKDTTVSGFPTTINIKFTNVK